MLPEHCLTMSKGAVVVLSLLAVSALTVFSFWVFWPPSRPPEKTEENIDGFIKVARVAPKVVVVGLGPDAVTAIAAQKGIIVIDAGISNSLTAKYRKTIESVFIRDDFAYLINTHSHPDHTGGNQVFAGAVIVGQENCPAEMAEYWKDPERIGKRWLETVNGYDKELGGLDAGSREWDETFCKKSRYQHACDDLAKDRIVTAPSLTFKDSLSLPLGDMTLFLVYFGGTHSKSDAVIHIPELKLLMTGDLFSPGGIPSLDEDLLKNDLRQRKKAVKWIFTRWNDIETVIGGHGRVMTKADLKLFIEYLESI